MFFRKSSDHMPHVTIFHTILRSMLWILFIEIALLVGILYLCRIIHVWEPTNRSSDRAT